MHVVKNGFWEFIPTRETHTEHFLFYFLKGMLGETIHSWLSQLREVNSPDGEYNVNGAKG